MNDLIVLHSSGVPIYKQLMSQIERLILKGNYMQGDALPSTRKVALELKINFMTVSKAYGLLEEKGYVKRLRGQGMIVAQLEDEKSMQEKNDLLSEMINKLILESKSIGISSEHLRKLVMENISKDNSLNVDKNISV